MGIDGVTSHKLFIIPMFSRRRVVKEFSLPKVCYKIVALDRNPNQNWLITAFFRIPIAIRETRVSPLIRGINYVFFGNFSFVNNSDARDAMERWGLIYGDYRVMRCEIPNGGRYYIGRVNDFKCIASDKITYKELL